MHKSHALIDCIFKAVCASCLDSFCKVQAVKYTELMILKFLLNIR
jgi:hypothetical protein